MQKNRKNVRSSQIKMANIPVWSITPGDVLYHEKYGDGFIFYKDAHSIKVYFSNTYVKSFSQVSPQIMHLTHHWNPTEELYTPPFCSCNSLAPSSACQAEFQAFINSQNQTLKNAVHFLINAPDTAPLDHNVVRCIHLFFSTVRNLKLAELDYITSPNKFHSDKYTLPTRANFPSNFFPSASNSVSIPIDASASIKPAVPLEIRYTPSSDTLYVYSGRIKCIRDNHTMTCVNALIDTASGEVAKLNVNCCLNCNRFYISYDEYERYMAKYKSLLTRIVLVNQNGESTFANNLAAESILKLCGYSVSQEKGLSQAERQRLLAKIIHADIVSKPDVIQHLNWLIKMNGKKAGNDIAKEKWEDDLFFVRNLDMRSQTNHKISSVSPYSSKKTKKRY